MVARSPHIVTNEMGNPHGTTADRKIPDVERGAATALHRAPQGRGWRQQRHRRKEGQEARAGARRRHQHRGHPAWWKSADHYEQQDLLHELGVTNETDDDEDEKPAIDGDAVVAWWKSADLYERRNLLDDIGIYGRDGLASALDESDTWQDYINEQAESRLQDCAEELGFIPLPEGITAYEVEQWLEIRVAELDQGNPERIRSRFADMLRSAYNRSGELQRRIGELREICTTEADAATWLAEHKLPPLDHLRAIVPHWPWRKNIVTNGTGTFADRLHAA
jgi:hypothetical protein